jgi:hypothetical protein
VKVTLLKPSRLRISRDVKPGDHLRMWVAATVQRVDGSTTYVEVVDSEADPEAGVCSQCWSAI